MITNMAGGVPVPGGYSFVKVEGAHSSCLLHLYSLDHSFSVSSSSPSLTLQMNCQVLFQKATVSGWLPDDELLLSSSMMVDLSHRQTSLTWRGVPLISTKGKSLHFHVPCQIGLYISLLVFLPKQVLPLDIGCFRLQEKTVYCLCISHVVHTDMCHWMVFHYPWVSRYTSIWHPGVSILITTVLTVRWHRSAMPLPSWT